MAFKRIDPKQVDVDYLRDEFNRFRSELTGLKERLGTNAGDVLDQMSAVLNGSNVSSRLATLENDVERLAGRLKGTGKDAMVKLEHQVGERPLASIAVAFGIGLLAAQLFRRS